MSFHRPAFDGLPSAVVMNATLVYFNIVSDLALLKAEWQNHKDRDWLAGRTGFPYIEISCRTLDEGEPVYSFGYPLSETRLVDLPPNTFSPELGSIGTIADLYARVTSAIISSKRLFQNTGYSIVPPQKVPSAPFHAPGAYPLDRKTGQRAEFRTDEAQGRPPTEYIIDKPLNPGNSGGPVIATETGKVCGFVRSFQPMLMPQSVAFGLPPVLVPSLYGQISSLSHPDAIQSLQVQGIQVHHEFR
jgi:hypothetical protein